MAVCPFAVWMPLTENHTQGTIDPRAVILHTAVSDASSLFGFFQHNSNLESHFYVDKNGRIEQYMDTRRRADANKNANSFAVSIETWDGRDPDRNAWTVAQVSALIRLVRWICDTHNIPKVQIPTAYGSGIGWHVQFGAPGPWTPVAKSCPGAKRIAQTKNVIIPGVKSGGGGSAPGTGDDDMKSDERAWLYELYKGYGKEGPMSWHEYSKYIVSDLLAGRRIEDKVNEISRTQKAVVKAVEALSDDPAIDMAAVERILRDAIDNSNAELLGMVEEVAREVVGTDNDALATDIVTKMALRLGGENVGEA